MRRKQIKSLKDLDKAAKNRRSVISPGIVGLRSPRPAAVILSWQGRMILNAIDNGLFVYERKNNKAPWHKTDLVKGAKK